MVGKVDARLMEQLTVYWKKSRKAMHGSMRPTRVILPSIIADGMTVGVLLSCCLAAVYRRGLVGECKGQPTGSYCD